MMTRPAGAWAGIIGPGIFVVISLIGGWVQPGYSAQSDYVSALSLGSHGWVQIASFIVVGVSLLLFAWALAQYFTEHAIPLGGPIIVAIVGFGYLLSGPFVMDPPGTPPRAISWHGLVHSILGAVVFTLMPVTCFIFLRHIHRVSAWRRLWRPTLILGCIVASADIAFAVIAKGAVITQSPSLTAIVATHAGLLQRLVIIPFLGWIGLLSIKLLRT